LIIFLILVPLLSSSVTAAVTFNAGSGTSTNTNPPGGCTVVFTMTAPFATAPGSTPPLTVVFSYNFIDSNAGPAGSNHICTMTVRNTATGGITTVSTGWTFVPSGGSVSGTLTTPPIGFSPPPPSIVFNINVTMTVNDLNAPPRGATGFGTTSITVN
jgi:hypothetical protein